MSTCAEANCDEDAAVRIHDPRGPDRNVCTAHGRSFSQQDGVVAVPLNDVEDWQ
jgi:hypothetical protein